LWDSGSKFFCFVRVTTLRLAAFFSHAAILGAGSDSSNHVFESVSAEVAERGDSWEPHPQIPKTLAAKTAEVIFHISPRPF
jgi:hypothetical protein